MLIASDPVCFEHVSSLLYTSISIEGVRKEGRLSLQPLYTRISIEGVGKEGRTIIGPSRYVKKGSTRYSSYLEDH